ncbi:uncharacterized protein ACLA_046270 [Aspergillus clavatus NRRL 1]|uniref:Uncharacterized protein n=1 Tax=Aspergillus clavatus (strain ATCC 1007 / CBS 513.65 / DSM 816 / NCTC 3887 / NRRL 1 / QM 1276 / 107) TaxID=344612 RepID=A1CH07_ASPCL|nr:uncharacterized protein ACLA_046270 [Aspergillus clavatus NRRL 1]EAW10162.1 conserved hypothetical protein [Aspergillus clavatus NRRL 1]
MDDEATERLKRLQMEDLGTLRREHISTADSKSFRNIRLKDIEATRMSNVAGTDAERVAKANAPRLNAWANVYKEIGDTQELEQLDSLLDGQSHRLQLRAVIQESGGQSYSKSVQKKDNFLKAAERAPSGRSISARGSKISGRGGGVIGTRGRVTKHPAPTAQPQALQQPVVSKLGNYLVESPHSRKRLQDPALDSNNDSPRKGREEYARKVQRETRGVKRELASLKKRRPISRADYSRILSPPESFLAVARNLVSAKTPSSSPPSVTSKSHEAEARTIGLSENAHFQSLEFIREHKDNAAAQVYDESVVSLLSERDSVAVATPASSDNGQFVQGIIVPTSGAANEEGQRPQILSLASSEQSPSGPADLKNQDKPRTQSDGPLSHSTELREPDSAVQFIEQETPSSPAEVSSEVLLDFDSTPPNKEVLDAQDRRLMSPAMEDLKGIYFQDYSIPVPAQKPVVPESSEVQAETVDLKDSLRHSEEESKSEKTISIQAKAPVDLDAIQKKIAGFYNFVESTFRQHVPGHLQDEDLQALIKYKKELIDQIPWPKQPSRKTLGQIAEQHQDNITYQEAPTIISEKEKETEESEIFSPALSTSSLAESTPLKKGYVSSGLPLDGSPSPSRFNAKAMPFSPGNLFSKTQRNTSFSEYRDPDPPLSSDSETSQSPVDHLQRTRQPSKDGAIMGSPSPSTVEATPQSRQDVRKPSESHIFGDHLLPGRRGGQAQAPGMEISSAEKPLNHGTLQPRVKFSIPYRPQASVFIPKETLLTFDKEDDQNLLESKTANIAGPSATTKDTSSKTMASVHALGGTVFNVSNTSALTSRSAPRSAPANVVHNATPKLSELQQSIHAPKPNPLQQSVPSTKPDALQQSRYAPRPNPLQQSIHAPKAQESNTLQKPNGPFRGGIGSSIYANPTEGRPLR